MDIDKPKKFIVRDGDRDAVVTLVEMIREAICDVNLATFETGWNPYVVGKAVISQFDTWDRMYYRHSGYDSLFRWIIDIPEYLEFAMESSGIADNVTYKQVCEFSAGIRYGLDTIPDCSRICAE